MPGERLYSASAFDGHLVLSLRRDVRRMLRAHRIEDDGSISAHGVEIAAHVDNGAVRLADNEQYEAASVTVYEDSYTTPRAWHDIELDSGDRHLVHQTSAPGYDPSDYVSELVWAPSPSRGQASDAAPVEVPVTVVRRRRRAARRHRALSAVRLRRVRGLRRAAVRPRDRRSPRSRRRLRARAHSRRWRGRPSVVARRQDGEQAEHVHRPRRGGRPTRRRPRRRRPHRQPRALGRRAACRARCSVRCPTDGAASSPKSPSSTSSPPCSTRSIPLTVNEWDEWGDPSRPDDYAWMKAYSPYDNPPPAGGRPDLLVTGALHDPRVMVFEPAKWVALLRHTDPQWSPRCVFRVELGAGAHVGPLRSIRAPALRGRRLRLAARPRHHVTRRPAGRLSSRSRPGDNPAGGRHTLPPGAETSPGSSAARVRVGLAGLA